MKTSRQDLRKIFGPYIWIALGVMTAGLIIFMFSFILESPLNVTMMISGIVSMIMGFLIVLRSRKKLL